MNHRPEPVIALGLVVLLCFATITTAAEAEGNTGSPGREANELDQTVTVTADRATFRQQDGSGLYQGNAELRQGNRRLEAERIEIFVDDNGELLRVEAEGSPLILREGEMLNARARQLVYEVPGERILLHGNAHIDHQGRTFSGSRIQYDLARGRVEASGEGEDRVRMVIPDRRSDGEKPQQ